MSSHKVVMNEREFKILLADIENEVGNLKHILSKIDDNLEILNGNNKLWQGRAQKILYGQYLDVSGKFPRIKNQLDEYIKFMKETLDTYKEMEYKMQSSVIDNKSDLDVG